MSGTVWLTECPHCEWSQLCATERFARILETCHYTEKHPAEYHAATGRDPKSVQMDLMEELSSVEFRRLL